MTGARVGFAAGLLLLAAAVAVVMSSSPQIVTRTNAFHPLNVPLGSVSGSGHACQGQELLPADTNAISVSLNASGGPSVTATVFSGETLVTHGKSASGWIGRSVTIPVTPLPVAERPVTVCFVFSGANEQVRFLGVPGTARNGATSSVGALHGRLTIEYLRRASSSWWSLALPVARRMGLGRAWAGSWIAVLIACLMASAIATASSLALRKSAWLCALVACLSAVSWSFITPAFQVPDEQAHFAYVEELARTHRLPSLDTQEYAPDEVLALEGLQAPRVSLYPDQHPIASLAQQQQLQKGVAGAVATSSPGVGAAGVAASEPPLYYALETIPYELGSGGGVLDELTLMRLMSALMAGVSALFVFLFVRESLPSSPRAWTVAGLAVAFLPLLGFISGAVNPDALLCAVSAAIFYCLARAFRRGLTPKLGVSIGALTAVGFLTKLNFIGLTPGILLGLALLAKRSSATLGGRTAARTLAAALAIASSPVWIYALVNLLSGHKPLGIASSVINVTAGHRSLGGEISYIWQLYLPRLPGMHVDFADISPLRELWFNGLVGQYGFEDTFFPRWVDNVAAVTVVVIAALAARELITHSSVLRRRSGELLVYLTMAVGLLVLIGASSYLSFPSEAAGFPEPRYLLPLIPLFGAVIALAARGGGRRWGASVGALIVVLFIAHDLFSQLQEIARFYG
jgi:hypothetical protein